jgi:protein SPT2
MARYNGDGYEDLDEYEEEGEEQEEEGIGEEEYEEQEEEEGEEPPHHTREELEYLELRQRLKESIRKQIKKESGSSLANTKESTKKLPYSNFGSFFGPSQPVIAQRVIQESKSLLENQHLAAKVSRPNHDKNRSSTSTVARSKVQAHGHRPKENEVKVSARKLKETRDYSFLLSDDAELPAPTKDPPPRHVSVPNSEARSALVPPNGKQSLNKTVRQVPNGREERKSMPTSSQMHPKAGSHKLKSASKPIQTSVEHRKQLGNSNGSGPGRPLGPKDLASKKPAAASERRLPTTVAKSSQLSSQKRPSSKLHSSASKQPSILKQHMGEKKEFQEYRKEKLLPKPQISRPPAKVSSRPTLQKERLKKKAVRQYSSDEYDEDEDAIRQIRKLMGYNPNKYRGRDEEDDSDMEANFDDIMMEEDRSARIARQEDEEELRKIEEEERLERERLKLKAKKRKLSQH